MRAEYDDLAVVCYINSTAELKRHSDVCVTSANAVKIVKNLPNKNIFFIPDRNLAHYIAGLVPEKHFIYNEGFCIVHEYMEVEEIQDAKKAHPDAEVLAHPECPQAVLELADYIGSTTGIINYAGETDAQEMIICTESGVLYELEKRYPEKKFYFTETLPVCRNMKKVTLEKILHVLKTGENEVFVDDALRKNPKTFGENVRTGKIRAGRMEFVMKMKADAVIVGTGVGGLFSALNLPRDKKIIMITKSDLESSDSFLAQVESVCFMMRMITTVILKIQ